MKYIIPTRDFPGDLQAHIPRVFFSKRHNTINMIYFRNTRFYKDIFADDSYDEKFWIKIDG